jgi:hypothetical protein
MTVKEFCALTIGTPVLDDQGEVCIVTGKSAERVTVAYGDDDARMFSARFDAFSLADPGALHWDGRRWRLMRAAPRCPTLS